MFWTAENMELPKVELGFIEKLHEHSKWKLTCPFFPSKVGGKPSWLNLKSLPFTNDLNCKACDKPCAFLMQVYCLIEHQDTCFHRMLYVFVCKNSDCCTANNSENFIVFRCQLPRKNDFYAYDPPDYETYDAIAKYPDPNLYISLCVVCGCFGEKRCSGCHKANYCCKDHQIIDWKNDHKAGCKDGSGDHFLAVKSFLFAEYELVTEPEEYEESDCEKKKSDNERMSDYETFLKSEKAATLFPSSNNLEADLSQFANKEDLYFSKFKKRITHEPEQVLRYQRRGQPLLASSEHTPNNIPNCSCGAIRQFEFQIVPHLLKYLNVDTMDHSIDWGSLIIFTCSANCDIGQPYHLEILWKQDFSINVPSLTIS